MDSSDAAAGARVLANNVVNTASGTLSSPSAPNASSTAPKIGAEASGNYQFKNNTRLGFLIAWESVALNPGSMLAFSQALRGKFGG